MKKILLTMTGLLYCFLAVLAQTEMPGTDKSPMDMSYYPNNFPLLKIQDKTQDPPIARVIYSRPKKEGRTVFGSLVEYNKLWRVGANEATEIEFFRPVTIAGKKIAKGRYTLYAIVNEKKWTFIINKELDTWGSFKYNQAKDLLRVDLPVLTINDPVESLAITFEASNTTTFNLVVAWERTKVALPITL